MNSIETLLASKDFAKVERENLNLLSLAEMIETASDAFRKSKSKNFYGPVNRIILNDRVFYGIHKDKQTQIDQMSGGWECLTRAVLEDMGLDPNIKRIQVVGDCSCYCEEGTAYNRKILYEEVLSDCLILWGFTGEIRNEGRTCDVNGLINEMIDAHPEKWAGRCLANVVSFQTPLALKNWGSCGSQFVKHFWLVYGDDLPEDVSTQATFGQDVHSSDNMSTRLVSLEGGIQSLNQMLRCVELDQPVVATTNTRGLNHEPSWVHSISGKPLYQNKNGVYMLETNPDVNRYEGIMAYVDGFNDKIISHTPVNDVRDHMNPEFKWYGDFFSVGSLCHFLQKKFDECGLDKENIPESLLASWWKEYASTHLLANPKAKNFSTKQALLEAAEKRFLIVGSKIFDLVTVKTLQS